MLHAEVVLATSDLPAAFRLLGVHDGVAEVAFVGADAPGLLAKIAAVFARTKVKVVTAQLFSWHAQVDPSKADVVRVMDVFTIQTGFDADRLERECKQYEREFAQIQDDSSSVGQYGAAIRYVESGLTDARWSPREAPRIPLRVRFDNSDASHHTILEVVTNDRADILFWIADTLHRLGLTIDSAKVHVEGARVTDVFYLRCPEAGKVEDPTRLSDMKRELTTVLRRVLRSAGG
jgi:UTP:GlnB (protein PII) uridylyltransferase